MPFIKGDPNINRQGRREGTTETPEEKLLKKARKDYISDYVERLEEALPLLSPVLIAKALEGDIQAIKEINDRVMGRPNQPNEHRGEITFKFDYDERGTENDREV